MEKHFLWRNNKGVKIVVSFILLFILYHTAEYWIMFKNNIPLFFISQISFFACALILGKWYSGNGLGAWGLTFSRKVLKEILLGLFLGILLYSLPYFLSLLLGMATIVEIPPFFLLLQAALPFAVGVLFTSFSEDILTRGLIFFHFNEKLKPVAIALLSAVIYLLNHIYRLDDGLDVWVYLFLLGLLFIIPVLHFKSLWITGAMHWAGNVFFFISHELIEIKIDEAAIGYNYLFSICILFMIPLTWIITRKFQT